ncbi:MAG: glycosyltransferase [Candidatus Cloacimonetes bacterium]|nr:glycosyltransferase [Candidatus Cloacimonadota bacterium]
MYYIFSYMFNAFLLFLTLCLNKGKKTLCKPNQYFTFSIVIAFKNEVQNLENLFISLKSINYYTAGFEIIFVDDNSSDNSLEIINTLISSNDFDDAKKLNISVLQSQGGKKAALQKGILAAKNDWIALTDADCIVPENWLQSINQHLNNFPLSSMIIGYSPEIYKNPFQYFIQLATAINYASTACAGFPFSCSGRNLAFHRHTFFDVNGYEGLVHIPSGDDKLLLKRFLSHKKKITYMPYPPMFTKPASKKILKDQKLRRYGKFSMSSLTWKLVMVMIGIFLIFSPIQIILRFSQLFYEPNFNTNFFQLIKTLSPFFLYVFFINLYMVVGCNLHKEKIRFIYFFYSLIFPYYLIFQMTYSLFKKWTWK